MDVQKAVDDLWKEIGERVKWRWFKIILWVIGMAVMAGFGYTTIVSGVANSALQKSLVIEERTKHIKEAVDCIETEQKEQRILITIIDRKIDRLLNGD